MNRRLLFMCIALLGMIAANAQTRTVSGIVTDQQSKNPLASATVKLSSLSDSSFAVSHATDSEGAFSFSGLRKDSFLLNISYVGYSPISKIVAVDTADIRLTIAAVQGESSDLSTIIVQTTISPVGQKEDTLQMNASQYKVNPDATTADLVRKMPGITVENGEVKAQGETVKRVTLDGRELFGNDATAALQSLPAEVVDKIQVFDRLSDQDAASGVITGETQKEINIVTKAGMRNGQFGRVYAGYGTDDRYSLGGNATFLKENRRISIVGQSNNINQQNFSAQDLLGVTSSGGRGGFGGGGFRGGGGRPGGFGGFGGFGGGGFMVGQQNGINKTNAIGINYSDQWGQKLRVTGSYFLNNSHNTTSQESSTEYLKPFRDLAKTIQESTSAGDNTNHRINMRIEYQIDSSNRLIISPNLSFQENSSQRLTHSQNSNTANDLTSETFNGTNSNTTGNNLNNNLLYSHNFAKRGRTFSINLNTSYNQRNGESYTDYVEKISKDSSDKRFTDQSNHTLSLNARLSYTEPLSTKSQLQFTYNPSWSKSKSDQMAYSFDPADDKYSIFNDRLSNVFDNRTTAQNGGIAYRTGDRDNQFTAGVNYQRTELYNNRTYPAPAFEGDKAFNNILPNAMARFKLSSRSNVRLFYRTNVNQPSITQLQDVIDATYAPSYTQGNPNLKPQYSHIMNGTYTFTNTGKGKVFVGNVFVQKANNYITNSTYIVQGADSTIGKITLNRTNQLSKPINVDGYYSLRSFLTFAVPMKFIKSNLNMNGGFNYSHIPGINNGVSIESNNYTYSLGTVVSSNVSEYIDFTVSYSANYNTSASESLVGSKLEKSSQNFFSHTGSVQLNLLSKKGWFFQNDLNNQLQWQNTTEQYWLWNMSVGKKFLKSQKAELKLTAFDVLKQNVSFSRSFSEVGNSIYTQRNQVLTQYFLLTFTYNLRNFGKTSNKTQQGANPERGGVRPGNFPGNFNRGGGNFAPGGQRF